MEFPRRAVKVERSLAALFIAAALAAAGLESGAPLAESVRAGRPYLAWVDARLRGSAQSDLDLAVYDPVRRRLILLRAPGSPRSAEARLSALAPGVVPPAAERLRVEIDPSPDEDERALAAALALKTGLRRPRAWTRLARETLARASRAGRAALDPLLLALELRRVPRERLQPARLTDVAQFPALLDRLLSASETPGNGRAIIAEVLNGTGRPGLAAGAAKRLRARGFDVLAQGTARPRATTVIYDRTGDFRRAVLARAALACPSARAVTLLDAARAVDVSVELGGDCAAAEGLDRP